MKKFDAFEQVEFRDLTFWYDQSTPIFEKVNFEFPLGKISHIKGRSGEGKSTLLKLLAGLSAPCSGEIILDGVDVTQLSFEEFIPKRLKIGFSFDLGGLLSNRTVWENLSLPLLYHKLGTPEEVEARVSEIVDIFELSTAALLRPSSIPGSRRKLAVVARSMILQPQLLLLDDPTTGLNRTLKSKLKNFILEQREKGVLSTVLVISEDNYFLNELVDETIEVSKLGLKLVQSSEEQGVA